MTVTYVGGPWDGRVGPAPMEGEVPAHSVVVRVPARFDSMLDTHPAVPREDHLYRAVILLDEGRVVFEWAGRLTPKG